MCVCVRECVDKELIDERNRERKLGSEKRIITVLGTFFMLTLTDGGHRGHLDTAPWAWVCL